MSPQRWAIASLSSLWCGTGLVSLLNAKGVSLGLMHEIGVGATPAAHVWVAAGAWLDLLLGIALWVRPQRKVFVAGLICVAGWTLLCSVLTPQYWLHPFGPLMKNLPIAALLWWLIQDTP